MRVGVAGKVTDAGHRRRDAWSRARTSSLIGRAAILHHDFPERVRANPDFAVDAAAGERVEHLRAEGLGPAFVDYMKTWQGFVAEA